MFKRIDRFGGICRFDKLHKLRLGSLRLQTRQEVHQKSSLTDQERLAFPVSSKIRLQGTVFDKQIPTQKYGAQNQDRLEGRQ